MSNAMLPAITDEQIASLLPKCKQGDANALEALYELFADRIFRYLVARSGEPELAAELANEVFVRVMGSLGRFTLNQDRPAASFSAWIYRISANLLADHYRRGRRLAIVPAEEREMGQAHVPGPQGGAEQAEALRALATAMGRLSEEQRLVIVGRFGEGMSSAEMAAWLGKSEGAVKALQHRALHALGRLLDDPER
jgi:RNA polymerase sigma-70 factor (ECF subfamily)